MIWPEYSFSDPKAITAIEISYYQKGSEEAFKSIGEARDPLVNPEDFLEKFNAFCEVYFNYQNEIILEEMIENLWLTGGKEKKWTGL